MEEQQRQFKGIWIPKEIWINRDLTFQEKMILVEIDSYDNGETGCFASNKHFMNLFNMTSSRVSQVIHNLQRKGYLTIDYEYSGKEIIKRYLHIKRPPYPQKDELGMLKSNTDIPKEETGVSGNDIGMSKNDIGVLKSEIDVCQKVKTGYVKKLKDNNTYLNNTIINNINSPVSSKQDEIPYKDIVEYLNLKAKTHYRDTSKKTKDLINARYNENFTIEDFKRVIDNKCEEWLNNNKMKVYLRPETLFGDKFESYLNQNISNKKDTGESTLRNFDENNKISNLTEEEQQELDDLLSDF